MLCVHETKTSMGSQNIGVKNADTQEHLILHDVALNFCKQYSIVDQTHFFQKRIPMFWKKKVGLLWESLLQWN